MTAAPTTAGPTDEQAAWSTMDGKRQGWVRRLWRYLLRHRRNLAIAMAAALVGSAAQATVPLIERQIVDNVILHHRSPLWPWLLTFVGLGIVIFALACVRRFRGGRVALDVQYDLRNEMQEHLQSLDFTNLDRMPTGQLVARANSDSTLVQALLSFFPIMSGNVLLVISAVAIMLFLSPLLAVVSLVVVPALGFVAYRMRDKIFPATWDGQQREGDVAQIVDEDVNGVRVVKAFGQERRELDRVVEASKRLYGSHMRATRLQSRYQPILQAIPSLGQVAVLALGGWLALRHEITLGTFLAFSTYLTQLVAPTRMLAGILTVGQQARAGIERIFQLLDLKPAIADPPGAVELGTLEGAISFDDVGLAYDDGPPVLEGLSLEIQPGETVALVGPSGSGKSSVANLVPRFYDVSAGAVRVDGVDVREVALASLRSQIGVVFEESFLFSDSVKANIAYGRPDATDAEIEEAARAAQAHDFINRLPGGYDTLVGERGLTLSGGQRQRITLARAILTDPRILILDDATSAVDARIEEEIHQALRGIMAGRTTLLVAHRRSTLHLADRIAVMEHGRIVEQGTHEALLERSALYRLLLAGLEDEEAEKIGDRIEALAVLSEPRGSGGSGNGHAGSAGNGSAGNGSAGNGHASNGTTASAWSASPEQRERALSAAAQAGRPSIGAGLGPGGGGWRMNLAPTPELLAKVAALRPIRDEAVLDVEVEAARDVGFRLGKWLQRYRASLGLGLVLVVLDALASIAGPVLVRTGIDKGVTGGSKAVLFAASAIYLVIALADMVDMVGETFVTGRTAERLMLALRVKIWAQLQRLSLDYYEREMAGRIMTRMTTDVDQFESLLENGLLNALVSFCTFFGVGLALVIMNWRLALATLTVVIPLAFATAAFRRRAARTYDLARDRIAVVNADFQESLSGVRESQAFVHEKATVARFHRFGLDYLEARLQAQWLVALYFPFVQFLAAVADAVVLGVGATLIAHGQLSTGALIAFVLYVDLFFSPIQQLSQVFDSWQQTRVSVARIHDLMGIDTLTPDAASPVDPGKLGGGLRLEGVRFSYPVQGVRPGLDRPATVVTAPQEALRGVTLEIRPGETIALVGETGAGKSTVMKLIARFYDPTAGRVLIDGKDLRNLDLTAYRRQLGYVPQEAFLFTGTVRDNIAYGRPEASDAEVEAAARAVGAHEFVAELPGGYLHVLSERGRSLSAGQRQLIALARAELVNPAVLLLDEATSNLDLATEARVAAAMRRVALGRTAIVIAHRLQTAKSADRIIVVDDGQVVEDGNHDELLERNGRYAAMWEAFDLVGGGSSREVA